MIYIFDLFGIAVFAISGALIAGKKQLDLFGVIVLAAVTAVGGGTLRDLLLQTGSVFWVNDPTYVVVATVAAIIVVLFSKRFKISKKFLLIADAFGLSLFSVLGTAKALEFDTPFSIAIVMGVLSGVAGGIIRDVLSGDVPLILRKDIYATASVLGASIFLLLLELNINNELALITGLFACLVLRLAAIKWHLSLPVFTITKGTNK